MAELGQLGAQTFRMSFPEQQLAQQEAQQLAVQPAAFNQPKDPLAYRGKLNRDYYTNYGLLESFVKEMAKQGIDVTAPDFSQPGGGELFQQYQILSAASMAAADALASEMKAETDLRQPLAEGKIRMKPGVNQEGLFYSDQNNFFPTAPTEGVREANIRGRQNTYTTQDQNRLNAELQHQRNYIDQQVAAGYMSPEEGEMQKQSIVNNVYGTYGPSLIDRSGGSNTGISAYVRKLSEVALGNNFEAGNKFDENGNRVDVARPSEFVGRQLGFTKDGKKFIVDKFERTALPEGGFKVEAVDAQGNRQPVDPNNITGTLRNFIETNEGAGALKDLNAFFKSQGFNTATQSVPANVYAQPVSDISGQTNIAPKVKSVRESIGKSLDTLSSGWWLKNIITGSPELTYKVPDGRDIVIVKDGDDKYSFKNFQEFYGKPKNGTLEIAGNKYPVEGTFSKVPKSRILQILEMLDVVSARVKDSSGEDVDVPIENQKPTAEDLIRKYSK